MNLHPDKFSVWIFGAWWNLRLALYQMGPIDLALSLSSKIVSFSEYFYSLSCEDINFDFKEFVVSFLKRPICRQMPRYDSSSVTHWL